MCCSVERESYRLTIANGNLSGYLVNGLRFHFAFCIKIQNIDVLKIYFFIALSGPLLTTVELECLFLVLVL